MTADLDHTVLMMTLDLAVPLHMMEMRGLNPDTIASIANDAATTVGSKGDVLQYGGKGAAEAFNALARGLAATALIAWGGATFRGAHWCTVPACPGPDGEHPQPVTPRPVPACFQPGLNARPITNLHLPDMPEGEAA